MLRARRVERPLCSDDPATLSATKALNALCAPIIEQAPLMPIRVTTRGNQQQKKKKKKKKKKKRCIGAPPQQTVGTARVERPTTLQIGSDGLSANPIAPGQDAMTDLLGLGQTASVRIRNTRSPERARRGGGTPEPGGPGPGLRAIRDRPVACAFVAA